MWVAELHQAMILIMFRALFQLQYMTNICVGLGVFKLPKLLVECVFLGSIASDMRQLRFRFLKRHTDASISPVFPLEV